MAAQASTPDWEAQWAYVNANPGDFDGWEKLIGLSEHNVSKASPEHIISNLRMVYESLLQRFPLCYGYWKKYAEWELILYDTVKAEQVHEITDSHWIRSMNVGFFRSQIVWIYGWLIVILRCSTILLKKKLEPC
jgi:hypothetical protein